MADNTNKIPINKVLYHNSMYDMIVKIFENNLQEQLNQILGYSFTLFFNLT